MTEALTPSVGSFVEASQRLRINLGTPATFEVPIPPTWPPGTKINPDTGMPYDATIKPTSEPFRLVVKTALIIMKQGSPLRPQSDTYFEPVGDMTGMDIIFDLAAEDYPDVEEASDVSVNGLNYKIEETKPFSMAKVIYRYLIYGRQH